MVDFYGRLAGAIKAEGIIAVTGTDAENVFLVLMARQLNPGIFVVAGAGRDSAKKTLSAAGADKVISLYDIGARRMAHAILRPTVIKFLEMAFSDDATDIQIEEIQVHPRSSLCNTTLMESGIRKEMNLIIVAIQTKDRQIRFNPGADTMLQSRDRVIAMGRARDIEQLESVLSR